MVAAFLAFGSNLGNRRENLSGARDALRQSAGVTLTALSALYETEPVGGPAGQGKYLNAVAAIDTTLSPGELLHLCQAVEARFGRQRQEHWGARTLDIDLLLYGNDIIQEPDLTLPHPQMHQRAFVLLPLTEVAAELQHPLLGLSIRQLLADLPGLHGVHRLKGEW